MKRKLVALCICGVLAATPLTAFADEKDDRIAELEAQVEELKSTIEELEEELSATQSTDQDEYSIGETWVVEGQWKLTIDSIEKMEERNEFEDTDPAAVYRVTYTYENLGYESEYMDLYFDLSMMRSTDSDNKMGYAYPNDIIMYPQETPVGAKCEAQACIGFENDGDFKIYVDQYDGNDVDQSAVFNIKVQ